MRRNVLPDVELIRMDETNEAFERLNELTSGIGLSLTWRRPNLLFEPLGALRKGRAFGFRFLISEKV